MKGNEAEHIARLTVLQVITLASKRRNSRMTKKIVEWMGSTPKCDLFEDHKLDGVMYDAVLKTGHWACLCTACFNEFTFGKLGMGLGQRYDQQPDGKWIKTGG